MIDRQDGSKGSVPAVSQSGSYAEEPAPQRHSFAKNKASWGAAILLAAGFVVALYVWGVDTDRDQFLAVAAQNDATVQIGGVSCVSIDPHQVVVDRKDYSDSGLAEAIVDILSIKTVMFSANDTTCPWMFGITVVPKLEPAVRYNGQFARYLVSIAICEKRANGSVNPNRCRSKNVYVFNPRVAPHDLFLIALVGLAKPQATEWEAFQRRKSQ